MFSIWKSPFGFLDLYEVSIKIGVVVSLIIQGILIVKVKKRIRYLLFLLCYVGILYAGSYVAAFVRCSNDGALDGKMNLWDAVLNMRGTHFLGYVITFALLFFPMAWFLRDLIVEAADYTLCSNVEILQIGELMAIGLPIQHIFNRIGCLCRGCCYGIQYDGIFAITLPYNTELKDTVFPCQILEILGMIIILVIVIMRYRKGQHVFGTILIGFSITFFIAEFFTANPYAVKHGGLTYVQIYSFVLLLMGILYRIVWDKLAKVGNKNE